MSRRRAVVGAGLGEAGRAAGLLAQPRGQHAAGSAARPVSACRSGPGAPSDYERWGDDGWADASLMPAIPRCGIDLTVLAMAERIADLLGD